LKYFDARNFLKKRNTLKNTLKALKGNQESWDLQEGMRMVVQMAKNKLLAGLIYRYGLDRFNYQTVDEFLLRVRT
jgi:hypothetical protein